MRWLLFLSRLAFICGVFFLLSISLLIRNWVQDEAISSTIIIIGYFIGLIIVPVVNICYLAVLIIKRKLSVYVPAWLVTANVFFLLILILYIFYFNDPYYHQK
ncbi:MAG: hypothetical protein JNK14_12685 [Chitinophagaceae bacterium]|nr:hypothetical protein [Chitinophagaceae bacterium]